jgi:hypothetical protein
MSILRNCIAVLGWAGLLVGSLAWIINTQLGEILPYLDCQQQTRFSAMASFAAVIVAFLAGAVSWQSAGRADKSAPVATSAFAAALNALSAAVFVFALSMQGIASLMLSGCER